MSSVHCDLRSTNSAAKCQQMMIPILNQDRIASARVEWLLWLFLLLKLRLADAYWRACMHATARKVTPEYAFSHNNIKRRCPESMRQLGICVCAQSINDRHICHCFSEFSYIDFRQELFPCAY